MSLILVDTSIWVDFFHSSRESKSASHLEKLIEEENDICICPIIYQEFIAAYTTL
jgi:predicted nucleic acid-binding protein